MSPPKPYVPADNFPNLTGAAVAGVPTVLLQEAGDQLLWYETWRNDYEIDTVSNTTPVVVTTVDNFTGKLVTGQSVLMSGTGVTAIDGIWFSITVTGANTFTLDGSTAVGAGTGGQVYELTLGLFSKLIDACNYLGVRLLGSSYTTGFPSMQGRKILRRPRVVLSDADHTINPSQGDSFELTPAPAAVRTIKLKYSNPAPSVGESMEIIVGGATATGLQYHVKREDGLLVIADIYGNAAGDEAPTARFDWEIPVFNVVSASNGTPIVITTQEPHVFVTGDSVTIAGCSDANANGSHVVTRTSATTFSLDGSTADGGGAGGTATGDQGTWRLGPNSGGGSAGGILAGPGA